MAAPVTQTKDERVREVSAWKRLLSRPELGAVAGAIFVFIFFAVAASDRGFLSPRGIVTWLEVSAQLGIIGIGATLLMIGGEFDLSVGSMIAAAGLVFLLPVVNYGWPVWFAILVAFAFAILVGWINGVLVNRTGLPSFIVTLAFLFILRGLALGFMRLITNTTQVSVRSMIGQREGVTTLDDAQNVLRQDWLGQFFAGDVGQPLFAWLAGIGLIGTLPNGQPAITGIPVSVVWWLGLAALASWILLRTQFGNWIFAVGGNSDAARNSGVPVRMVRLILFMGTAVCATIFALLQIMDVGSTDTVRGTLKEFEAIIVAVIGGTLLTGGYGSVIGAVFGALIYGITQQGIFFSGWNTDWFRAILGAGLLLAVLLNNFIRKQALEAK